MDRTDGIIIERTIHDLATPLQRTTYISLCTQCEHRTDNRSTAYMAAADAEQHLREHLEERLIALGLRDSEASV